MSNRPLTHKTILLLTFAGLLLPGCLERKETIRVVRNGSVEMLVELRGDVSDFETGDALPTRQTGWRTKDELETKDNGDQEKHRVATRKFSAGVDLPDSYAAEDDPQYGIALLFPTEVEIERRRDGTYYNFKRVYQAREFSRYNIYHEQLKDEVKEVEQLGEKNPEELTDEERARLVRVLRTLEALKQTEFVAAGAEALEDEWPQHYGLLLRQAVLDHFEQADMDEILALLAEPQNEERDASVSELGDALIATMHEVLIEKMRELRIPHDQMEVFFESFDEEQARAAVTDDLNDEQWEVRVELPGEIVAHNGIEVEGREVVWKFSGEFLHDRDQVLMATSRVTRDTERQARADQDRE